MKRKVFVCTLYPCLWQYWCYAVTSRIKHRTCLASGSKLYENIDFFACCNCCFTENFFSNAKSILYYIEVRDWSLKSALLINFLCIDSVSSEKLQQYFHKPRFQAFFQHFIKEATSMENMSQIHLLCFTECVLSHIIIYLGHDISVDITNFPYRCVNAPIQQ